MPEVKVETLCCGHTWHVDDSEVEDGKYRPYEDSDNYIECPNCEALSGLYMPNLAAVRRLQNRDAQSAANRAEKPSQEHEVDKYS